MKTIISIIMLVITIQTAAQEFELKQYFFVELKKGPNRNQDSTIAMQIQEGHLKNITDLSNEGKLVCAGPFGDDEGGGILILNVPDFQEAEKLVKKDPAVISGRLSYKIRPWWTDKRTFTVELDEYNQ